MQIEVRKLHEADYQSWKQVWEKYLAFYEASLSDEVKETYWQRLLSSVPGEYNCIVATQDRQIIGLAHYLFHRHGWSIENVCYLQDLFVDESCRNQGVGQQLIDAVGEEAKQNGISKLYWLTHTSNHSARHLYDKIATDTGFLKYERPC